MGHAVDEAPCSELTADAEQRTVAAVNGTAPIGTNVSWADGPPAELLTVETPDLSRFGVAELRRILVVTGVVVRATFVAAARSVPASLRAGWRGRSAASGDGRKRLAAGARAARSTMARAAANGAIDGFIDLGATFVKLGQVIASSPGLFPSWLAEPARRCLDQVPPFSSEEVRASIEADLGAPIDELFSAFDDTPLSAASIGQVHAVTMTDGRDAVVKVQRPNLRESMTRDLRVLHAVAALAQRTPLGRSSNPVAVVDDLNQLTARELNPVLEAWNQHQFRERLSAFGDNSGITAPVVHWDRCGRSTICMERVYGVPMDDFTSIDERGIDAELVLRRGAKAWAEAVLIHGPFHGDLHAGNIWVLDDGRGCFLDFGIMGELDDTWRDVARDLYFTCAFDRDFSRVAKAYRSVGVFPPDMGTDEEIGMRMSMILTPMLDSGIGALSLGDMIASSIGLMSDFGGTAPQEMMLVAKQLLYIERYTKELAPEYAVITDAFLVRNVFPEAAADYLANGGTPFPDPA